MWQTSVLLFKRVLGAQVETEPRRIPQISYHTLHTPSSSCMFPQRKSSVLNYTAYSRTVPYTVLRMSVTDWTVCLIWRHVPHAQRQNWRCATHAAAVKHAAQNGQPLPKNLLTLLNMRFTGCQTRLKSGRDNFQHALCNMQLSYIIWRNARSLLAVPLFGFQLPV